MLDADAVINNSSQKVGGSNAYPDPAPKKVGGSRPRKTHRIYASGSEVMNRTQILGNGCVTEWYSQNMISMPIVPISLQGITSY